MNSLVSAACAPNAFLVWSAQKEQKAEYSPHIVSNDGPHFCLAKATYSLPASLNSMLSFMRSVLKVHFPSRKPKHCLNLPQSRLNPQVRANSLF